MAASRLATSLAPVLAAPPASSVEADLRATTERLSRLLASLGGGVLVEDEHRRILLANQTFCDLFGIPAPPASLVGADCSDSAEQSKALFADPEAFVERIAFVLASREQVLGEELELADGRILLRDYIPVDIDGVDRGHMWHYRDVTERRRAVRAALASEARWRATVHTALDCVVSIDRDGLVVDFNPAAEQTFGYAREQALGRELSQLIVPERFREAHRAGLARVAATGESRLVGRRIEIVAMRADGSELPVELSIIDVPNADPPLFTAYLRDISQRREAEREKEDLLRREQVARRDAEEAREELARQNRQLLELDAVKDELVARVSHELRTPLTSMLSFLQLSLESPLPDETRGFLEVAQRNANRLVHLVEDLLLLARADAGRLTIEPQRLDLCDILREACTAIQPVAKGKGLALALDERGPGDPAPVAMADRMRVLQVLDNILGNAVKFTPRGGTIAARARVVRGRAQICIEDTGVGIAEEDRARVFERFTRGAAARQQETPGAGLGLAIVRTIVEAHGGTVSLTSQQGRGTTVLVELPLAL